MGYWRLASNSLHDEGRSGGGRSHAGKSRCRTHDTFASGYSDRISLAESVTPGAGAKYGVRATGQKALITF